MYGKVNICIYICAECMERIISVSVLNTQWSKDWKNMINRSNILLKLKLKTNSFSFKIYMFWATKKNMEVKNTWRHCRIDSILKMNKLLILDWIFVKCIFETPPFIGLNSCRRFMPGRIQVVSLFLYLFASIRQLNVF